MIAQARFPLYENHNETRPAKRISLTALLAMIQNPTTRPKAEAQCLTPFDADGKKKAMHSNLSIGR